MNKLLSLLLHGVLNWKTTGTSIIGGVAMLLSAFHIISITPDQQAQIFAVTLIAVGWFAKDSSVVGVI